MKCSFISDLHLDAATATRNEAFAHRLNEEAGWCDELYVLGDLTEVWVGDDDDSPFVDFLRQNLRLASQRCRIVLMHGNRDFLLGGRFAESCGVELAHDPLVIERNDKRLLLCHGDTLCTDDVEYQRLRAVLRSPAWRDDTLAKPLSERRAMAERLRERSRIDGANKPANIMDVAATAVRAELQAHAADVLIHGHTHRPALHRATTTLRIVLGDWDRCGWLLRFDGAFSLQRFALATRCGT